MKNKKLGMLGLILMTAMCGALSTVSYKASAAEKNGILYLTKKDVKNGKVVIKNKDVKAIVVKKSVENAIIRLSKVKVSGTITFEKGDYVLQTKKSSVKGIKITQKDTNVKLDKTSDLNNKNFSLKVSKGAAGNLDLSAYNKKMTAEFGKNTDIKISMGEKDGASLRIKKSYESSKLEVSGSDETSKISKITVENPLTLIVKVNTAVLETLKEAQKASITIESRVDEIKNEAKSEIKDNTAENKKDDTNTEKPTEDKAKEDKANTGSVDSGSYVPGGSVKKATAIALAKEGGEELDADGKTIKIKVTYTPADATDKNLDWIVEEGTGRVKIASSNSTEAVIEALANGNYKIKAKIKNSTVSNTISGTVSNQGDKALEKSVSEYEKITTDKINKDNYSDIKTTGDDIKGKLEAKIAASATDPVQKAKWEALKTKITNKIAELAAKINEIKQIIDAAKAIIGDEYDKIKGAKPEAGVAKEAVAKIEAEKSKISENDFNAIVTDKVLFEAIKAEVTEFKKIVTASAMAISDTGSVNITPQTVSVNYKLVKTTPSETVITENTLDAGKTELNFLKEMRNKGVGKYKFVLFKKFEKLQDYPMGETVEKEVKVFDRNFLGTLKIKGANFEKKAGSTDKVRIDFDAGTLEWDEIPDADMYDVAAEFSVNTTSTNMGKYVLLPTGADFHDYSNIENENTHDTLTVTNYTSRDYNKNFGERLLVAKNLTERRMSLKELVPYLPKMSNLWEAAKNDQAAIKIRIIPKRLNGLTISDMHNMLLFSSGIDSVFIDEITVEDFYKKFYKETAIHD